MEDSQNLSLCVVSGLPSVETQKSLCRGQVETSLLRLSEHNDNQNTEYSNYGGPGGFLLVGGDEEINCSCLEQSVHIYNQHVVQLFKTPAPVSVFAQLEGLR